MEGIVNTDPVPAVEAATPGRAERTAFDGSGGGHGSAVSCPWSLKQEQQVHNLKEIWKRTLYLSGRRFESEKNFEVNPWFAKVVVKLRVDPCLDSTGLIEIDQSLLGKVLWGAKMSALDLAILMGDLKMIQKILESSSDPNNVIRGLIQDLSRTPNPKVNFLPCTPIFDTHTKTGILYSPLHLAVTGGDSHIVDVLLEKGADVNAINWLSQTPLDLALKMENVTMLQKLLKKDRERKQPIHVAVRYGDVELMKKLPSLKVIALDYWKTPLHYLAAKRFLREDTITNIVQYLDQNKALHLKVLDSNGLSAFYVAVLNCNTKLVIVLLDSYKKQIRLNEACDEDRGPPIQIAFEGGHLFKDIHKALMECEPVKGYMDKLYRDRQVYVDAANAILVGAALIASVTFASWLQPPLSYTSYSGEGYSSSIPAHSTSDLNYVDVEYNIPLRAFWVFNALSFYFAIGTVVCGARSVLPRSHLFIEKIVEELRTNLWVTSILLACSVLFVIIAFAIAGTIVLTPLLKYQWRMIVPTIVGGMICTLSLVFLVKNMVENYFSTRDDSYRLVQKDKEYLRTKGYIVELETKYSFISDMPPYEGTKSIHDQVL